MPEMNIGKSHLWALREFFTRASLTERAYDEHSALLYVQFGIDPVTWRHLRAAEREALMKMHMEEMWEQLEAEFEKREPARV